jgi:hypothetical protein
MMTAASSTVDAAYHRGFSCGWYAHRPETFNEDTPEAMVLECSMLTTPAQAAFLKGYRDSVMARSSVSVSADRRAQPAA